MSVTLILHTFRRSTIPYFAAAALGLLAGGGGCASRGDHELLESRLRQQESFITDLEKELTSVRGELQVARRDADSLRGQLADRGRDRLVAEQAATLAKAESIKFNPLLTRGLDEDGEPGDEALSVLLMPVDKDGELLKVPGVVDLQLVDLSLPASQQKLGQWSFATSETREHWHRGLVSAGFLFQLDWQRRPVNQDLILHASLITPDGRRFTTDQALKVTPPIPDGMANRTKPLENVNGSVADQRPASAIEPAGHQAVGANPVEPAVATTASEESRPAAKPRSAPTTGLKPLRSAGGVRTSPSRSRPLSPVPTKTRSSARLPIQNRPPQLDEELPPPPVRDPIQLTGDEQPAQPRTSDNGVEDTSLPEISEQPGAAHPGGDDAMEIEAVRDPQSKPENAGTEPTAESDSREKLGSPPNPPRDNITPARRRTSTPKLGPKPATELPTVETSDRYRLNDLPVVR